MKYKIYVEKKFVVGDNFLLRKNSNILGWYNIHSLISFLKENYCNEDAEIIFLGLNKIDKNEIKLGLENLLKENKKLIIDFLERKI